MEEFFIYFNKRKNSKDKQWIKVVLWDVHPNTFQNWGGGRWGYFIAKWENPKIGFFGELHFVKSGIREDTVVHEMFHVLCEWIWSNRDAITRKTEEKYAEFLDELVRKFYKEYKRRENKDAINQ